MDLSIICDCVSDANNLMNTCFSSLQWLSGIWWRAVWLDVFEREARDIQPWYIT